MPNDAKLGLVAGVALVVLIATPFFRKNAQAELTVPSTPAPKVTSPVLPAAPRLPSANDNDLPPPPVLPENIPGAG